MSELITDGDFTLDPFTNSWDATSEAWTWNNLVPSMNFHGSDSSFFQNIGAILGHSYQVTIDFGSSTQILYISLGEDANYTTFTGPGLIVQDVTATGGNSIFYIHAVDPDSVDVEILRVSVIPNSSQGWIYGDNNIIYGASI